jgi:hypothetical protein
MAVTLFHGTRVSALGPILAAGFQVEHDATACPQPCRCAMLGPGVYLAEADKASSNAGRAASAGRSSRGDPVVEGIVLECAVDLGKCAVLSFDATCACCGRRGGVDHAGSWAAQHDSAFLDGGGPAAKRAEWCVRDPARVQVTAYYVVRWTARSRHFVSRGPRVPVSGPPP